MAIERTVSPNIEAIQRLRAEKALPVDALAHKAKLTRRTLQRILSGSPCFPSTLELLATALGVEPAELSQRDATLPDPKKYPLQISLKLRKPVGVDEEKINIILGGLSKLISQYCHTVCDVRFTALSDDGYTLHICLSQEDFAILATVLRDLPSEGIWHVFDMDNANDLYLVEMIALHHGTEDETFDVSGFE